MDIGKRIIFNPITGTVLNYSLGEMSGDIQSDLRPSSIDFIDLPMGYSDNHFDTAVSYHVDPSTKQIVVTQYWDTTTNTIVTL